MRTLAILFLGVLSGCGIGLCLSEGECRDGPLAQVRDLNLVGAEFEDQSFTLRWAASFSTYGSPLTYRVYRSVSPNLSSLDEVLANGTLAAEVVDSTVAKLDNLDPSVVHFFNVTVTDRLGKTEVYTQRGPFCGGTGTADDPYQICDSGSLQLMQLHLDAHYALTGDIDGSEMESWNSGKGFSPIAKSGFFTGTLNGNGYTIDRFFISRPAELRIAMIANAKGGVTRIENLNLTNVNVGTAPATNAAANTAAILAFADDATNALTFDHITVKGTINGGNGDGIGSILGTTNAEYTHITNSRFEGSISGNSGVGSIVGIANGWNSCSDCIFHSNSATGTVTGTDTLGGLVGYGYGLKVFDSSFRGTVTGSQDNIGGLVGGSTGGGSIRFSFFDGTVTGRNLVGGLAGFIERPTYDSYALGSVSGNSDVGGLIGNAFAEHLPIRSYALNTVSGATNTGGLVGSTTFGVLSGQYSYWDVTTSGQIRGIGDNATQEVVGQYEKKSLAELQNQATFTSWLFDFLWTFAAAGETPTFVSRLDCQTIPNVIITDSSTRFNGSYSYNAPTKEITLQISRVSALATTFVEVSPQAGTAISLISFSLAHAPTQTGIDVRWNGPPPDGSTVTATYSIPKLFHQSYDAFIVFDQSGERVLFEVYGVCQ